MAREKCKFDIDIVQRTFSESICLKEKVRSDEELLCSIAKVAEVLSNAIAVGGKILICGNGGSASDALHFCGEIVGRFQRERKAAPAIPLNADIATMTAVSNDYGFEFIFERGVQAYMKPEDVFIGISTSGNSENVLRAAKLAGEIGGTTVGLLGMTGGRIKDEVDYPIIIPCKNTARVQEVHSCIIHIVCDLVERTLD